MITTLTARYARIQSGYMGQIVEWPEVVPEGKSLEECREMLKDALQEMIAACLETSREILVGNSLLEQIPVEYDVRKTA